MPATGGPSNEQHVEALRKGLSGERRVAAISLARAAIRGRASLPRVLADALGAALGDPASVRRESACCAGDWALADLAPSLERLVAQGKDAADPDAGVRAAAVRALARVAGRRAAPVLGSVALGDPAHDVRAAAVAAIGPLLAGAAGASQGKSPGRGRAVVRTRGTPAGARAAGQRDAHTRELRALLERIRESDPSALVAEIAAEVLEETRARP